MEQNYSISTVFSTISMILVLKLTYENNHNWNEIVNYNYEDKIH